MENRLQSSVLEGLTECVEGTRLAGYSHDHLRNHHQRIRTLITITDEHVTEEVTTRLMEELSNYLESWMQKYKHYQMYK